MPSARAASTLPGKSSRKIARVGSSTPTRSSAVWKIVGSGLRTPSSHESIDGVEQLVERELAPPGVAVLADVVGDDRGAQALGPHHPHRLHHEAAVDLVGHHHREHLAGVEAEAVRPRPRP